MDGRRLKRLRKSRGLSAQRLADRVGVNARHIYAVEAGRYRPSLSFLERTAAVLEVPVAWFFLPDGLSADALAEINLSRFAPHLLAFLARSDAAAYVQLATMLAEADIPVELLRELAEVLRRMTGTPSRKAGSHQGGTE